jgi:hypothetical protein
LIASTKSLADADWEARTSLWLGFWLAAAPWLLGFADRTATFLHLSAGTIISLLSAVELWSAQRTPPRRFRPGAARRADVFDVLPLRQAKSRKGGWMI